MVKLRIGSEYKILAGVLLSVAVISLASLSNPASAPWWICACAVASLILMVTRRTVLAIKSRRWPSLPASKQSARVVETEESYVLRVRYTYAVNGQQYVGSRIRLPFGIVRSTDALHVTAKRIRSRKAVVYFDPGNPGVSTLEPGLSVLDGVAVLVFYIATIPLLAFLVVLALNARQA
jgi:hypothetical protein